MADPEKGEIEEEVEAMEAMYGVNCKVVQRWPHQLKILLTPNTADDTSVQFVEVVLVLTAGEQYPEMPPEIELEDAKGLDDKRQVELLSTLRTQAAELFNAPMLVSLCEAAKDVLTGMNFPDGDCCFCRYPFVLEAHKPFFKLNTCFHCFHSECLARWFHYKNPGGKSIAETSPTPSLAANSFSSQGVQKLQPFICPICRSPLNVGDIAHVMEVPLAEEDADVEVDTDLLTSEEELHRKAQFAAQFETQKARGGIIESEHEIRDRVVRNLVQASLLDDSSTTGTVHTQEQQTAVSEALVPQPDPSAQQANSRTISGRRPARLIKRQHGQGGSNWQKRAPQ